MTLARVVSFEQVDREQLDEMGREMREGPPPEGLEASELIVLHDPEQAKALAIVFFDNEDDYRRGDQILDAMPAGEAPGRRSSVTKYDVAVQMTPTPR